MQGPRQAPPLPAWRLRIRRQPPLLHSRAFGQATHTQHVQGSAACAKLSAQPRTAGRSRVTVRTRAAFPLRAAACEPTKRLQLLRRPATLSHRGPGSAQQLRLAKGAGAPWLRSEGSAGPLRATATATVTSLTPTGVVNSRFNTKAGNIVKVQVTPGDQAAEVTILIEMPKRSGGKPIPIPILHWGMHRAALDKWYHPQEAVPPDSKLHQPTGGMRTLSSLDKERGAYVVTMKVPNRLMPLYLSMVVLLEPAVKGGKDRYDGPLRGTHMRVALGMAPGSAEPLGASLALSWAPSSPAPAGTSGAGGTGGATNAAAVGQSVNFSVFSRHAKGMSLVLVRVKTGPDGRPLTNSTPIGTSLIGVGSLEIALDPITNRTGDCWHVCVHNLKNPESMCYGWRASGNGDGFHAGYVLLDPYATRVALSTLPESYFNAAPTLPPYLDMNRPVMLASLASLPLGEGTKAESVGSMNGSGPASHSPSPNRSVDARANPSTNSPQRFEDRFEYFDWQGLQRPVRGSGAASGPRTPARTGGKSVICEIDIPTFAGQGSGQPPAASGQFPAASSRFLALLERVPLLVEAGVTSVVLHLVCACGGGGEGGGRRTPLAFFAPDPALASSPLAAPNEFKQVIRALHAVGLEVLLGVEFCATAEATSPSDNNNNNGLQGLAGLDRDFYYRQTVGGQVLKAGHPLVRSLVLDCLHHWVDEYCVDGFVFLAAEHLTQDQFGSIMDSPPLPEEIATDPILRHLRLIAAPGDSDLLPRNGQRGFPHWGVWAQWNGRFATDMRAYLQEDARGLLSAVATRLTGSPDLFAAQWDAGLPGGLATGRIPRQCINATQPAATPTAPLPAPPPPAPAPTYGGYGGWGAQPSTPYGGQAAAGAGKSPVAAAKLMLLAQFAAAGVPAFHSSLLLGPCGQELARFLGLLSTIRRTYGSLLSPPALDSPRDVSWQGTNPFEFLDWSGTSSNVLAYSVGAEGKGVLTVFNPQPEAVTFILPAPPEGCHAWRKVVDTTLPSPQDATLEGPVLQPSTRVPLPPSSGLLFMGVPTPATGVAGTGVAGEGLGRAVRKGPSTW